MKLYSIFIVVILNLVFSQTLIFAQNLPQKSCITAIKLHGTAKRVGWGMVSQTGNYRVHILYKDGRIEEIRGTQIGFCERKILNKKYSRLLHSLEEQGHISEILKKFSYINDTKKNSPPGPADDFPGMVVLLNRIPASYNDDGNGYHFKSMMMSSNKLGILRQINLPANQYFSSRGAYPFIAYTNPGYAGFATIKGHTQKGVSLAVYGYYEGRLSFLAQTKWHSRKMGGLEIVGGTDTDLSGCPEIYIIRDPKGDAVLELWEVHHKPSSVGTPFTLIKKSELKGFSNHIHGTWAGGFARFSDLNGDSFRDELIIADKSRKVMRILAIRNTSMREIKRFELPARINNNISFIEPSLYRHMNNKSRRIAVPLDDNTLRIMKLPKIRKPASPKRKTRFRRIPGCQNTKQ